MGGLKAILVIMKSNLNAQAYITQILAPEVVPFILRQGKQVILQHDKSRPNIARLAQLPQRCNINFFHGQSTALIYTQPSLLE